jgi:hypothetical protein
MTTATPFEEALRLAPKERLQLVEQIVASVEQPNYGDEVVPNVSSSWLNK